MSYIYIIISRFCHTALYISILLYGVLIWHWSLPPFQRQKDDKGVQDSNILGQDENVSRHIDY